MSRPEERGSPMQELLSTLDLAIVRLKRAGFSAA